MSLLDVKNIMIRFGGLVAVDNFSLEIDDNELVGLIGPNGAGKTTIFNMITGVYKPTEGFITYNNERIDGFKTYEINRKKMARTFQNIRLFGEMTVIENVIVACNDQIKYNIFDAVIRTNKFYQTEDKIRKEALELLKIFNIDEKADVLAKNLPYGEQRKLEIVRALASKPKLLLLDEPAAGMNPNETAELALLIKKIREEFKISILLIEHDMKLVMGICDKVAVVCFGKTLTIDKPKNVMANPKVIEAYLGAKNTGIERKRKLRA
jgi:ABC-type branched-chain amino acid transport systems, ATPase component